MIMILFFVGLIIITENYTYMSHLLFNILLILWKMFARYVIFINIIIIIIIIISYNYSLFYTTDIIWHESFTYHHSLNHRSPENISFLCTSSCFSRCVMGCCFKFHMVCSYGLLGITITPKSKANFSEPPYIDILHFKELITITKVA